MPDFAHERRLRGVIAGIDEAGRGPLAGPVVAAALVIDRRRAPSSLLECLDDSKKLSPAQRQTAFANILAARDGGIVRFGVGAASVVEIDHLNILAATFLAMRRALAHLPICPDAALVDGDRAPPGLGCRVVTIVGGDGASFSIAAASIVAKVIRDRAMTRLGARYAGFGWLTNVGYGCPAHLEGLARFGPTRHHRLSFSPMRQGRLAV